MSWTRARLVSARTTRSQKVLRVLFRSRDPRRRGQGSRFVVGYRQDCRAAENAHFDNAKPLAWGLAAQASRASVPGFPPPCFVRLIYSNALFISISDSESVRSPSSTPVPPPPPFRSVSFDPVRTGFRHTSNPRAVIAVRSLMLAAYREADSKRRVAVRVRYITGYSSSLPWSRCRYSGRADVFLLRPKRVNAHCYIARRRRRNNRPCPKGL